MSYTRIPNDLIDKNILNPYQFQIFSIIVRKTDGWCKTSDGISLSQFEKMVHFSKPKIISTLKELKQLGFITITQTKNKNGGNSYNLYSVNAHIVEKYNQDLSSPTQATPSKQDLQGVVNEVYKGSKQDLLGVVNEVYKQKKDNTKETNNNTKEKCKKDFDIFRNNILKELEKNKLKSFSSKVNKTKSSIEAFEKLKKDKSITLENFILLYLEHIKNLKTYAKRLDKFMWSFLEGHLFEEVATTTNYQQTKKQYDIKTTAETIDLYFQQKHNNANIINAEVCYE